MTENEYQNDLGALIKDGYWTPAPRTQFVRSLLGVLGDALKSLSKSGIKTPESAGQGNETRIGRLKSIFSTPRRKVALVCCVGFSSRRMGRAKDIQENCCRLRPQIGNYR